MERSSDHEGSDRQAARWSASARAAITWRQGEPVEPVLEALALSVALEAVGVLAEVSQELRAELRRVGQRAMLYLSAEIDHAADEEALRVAASLARHGLRALSGEPVPLGGSAEVPSPRELARLIAGTAEPFEAASIALRARGSDQGRRELAWAQRIRGAEPARVRLAAADGEPMRDPASGRLLARFGEGDEAGEPAAEIYGFGDGRIAIYTASAVPVRLEAPGACTDAMQPGYWAGRAQSPITGTLHVGERAIAIHLPRT